MKGHDPGSQGSSPARVDLEKVRAQLPIMEIARRFFAPREVATLSQVTPHERVEAFFRCWTRKEACVKAMGRGISLGIDLFELPPVQGEPAALLNGTAAPEEISRWMLLELRPNRGYAAALAVEAHD